MNAKRDENHVATMTAVLNTDGQTVENLEIIDGTHRLKVSDGTDGSDLGNPNSQMDENHVPCLMAVSSVDGVTPVALYVDANGHLLVTNS